MVWAERRRSRPSINNLNVRECMIVRGWMREQMWLLDMV